MNPRTFVIPDIHGCARTFRKLVCEVIALSKDDDLYLLGDLIDRGPDSKGVLDFIFELRKKGFSVMSVKGNHEDICFKSVKGEQFLEMWLANGGFATMQSMKISNPEQIPEQYQYYLHSLPNYILLEKFVIVHGGLNFSKVDPFGDIEAMLWMREGQSYPERIGNRRLVCGHTPVSREVLSASLSSSRIMLDNGCVYAGRQGMGSLAALELNSMKLYFQENIDC